MQTPIQPVMGNNFFGRSYVMFWSVIIFGCLVLPATSGHPQPLEGGMGTMATAAVNSTSTDEDKIYVVFCEALVCDYFGHGIQNCFCCPDGHLKENCHLTMEECRASCAVCNPKCPLLP